MDAVRVILYNIIAVLCYSTAPVSLQQYCKDYNTDDPQCGELQSSVQTSEIQQFIQSSAYDNLHQQWNCMFSEH